MATTEKFSSKMDRRTLRELRAYAKETKKPISSLLDEAVSDYLSRVRVRSTFQSAAAKVIEQHAELLEKLAR